MKMKTHYALVVERDTTLRNSWAETLHDLSRARVLKRARPAEVRDLVEPGMPVVVMVAGLSARGTRDDTMLSLIAEVRRQAEKAVILAVDHGNRPLGAVDALAAGACDVLRGDHHPAEFHARAALRLRQLRHQQPPESPFLHLGLTPVELQLLHTLHHNRDTIVTREMLAQALGEEDWIYGDRRFDVHVAHIRRKLKEAFGGRYHVRTIRSRGYVLEETVEPR